MTEQTVSQDRGLDKGAWNTPVLVEMTVGIPDVRNKATSTPDATLGQSLNS